MDSLLKNIVELHDMREINEHGVGLDGSHGFDLLFVEWLLTILIQLKAFESCIIVSCVDRDDLMNRIRFKPRLSHVLLCVVLIESI